MTPMIGRQRMQGLERLADLIWQRNVIEVEITKITGRPASLGGIGEYLAAQIFRISLVTSANQKGIDGHFQEGALRGATVNINGTRSGRACWIW